MRKYLQVSLLFLVLLLLVFTSRAAIQWETCSIITPKQTTSNLPTLFSPKPLHIAMRSSVSSAECGLVDVPLNWMSSSSTHKVKVFVKVLRTHSAERKGQLWLLNGGPGATGEAFDGILEYMRDSLVNYDIVTPDHRGAGRSTFMGESCLQKGDSLKDCIAAVHKSVGSDGVAAFGTTMAAHDVMHIANLISNGRNDKIVLYGVSYGTFWMNRILTLYPNNVTMAIADSPVPPQFEFSERDDHFFEIGVTWMKLCKGDAFCAAKLGLANDTSLTIESFMTSIMEKQSSSKACHGKYQSFGSAKLKQILAFMLTDSDMRKLIFPTVYRVNRCNSNDKAWLDNLGYSLSPLLESAKALTSLDTPVKVAVNPYLFFLVTGSEISKYPNGYTKQHFIDKYSSNSMWFGLNLSASLLSQYDQIKEYIYEEPLQYQFSNFSGPMLTLQGTLDPQTPPSQGELWKTGYNLNETYVSVRNAGHGVIFSTMITELQVPAGLLMVLSYITNDGKVVDTTLIPKWSGYNIDFNTMDAKLLEITTASDDLFEGGPSHVFQDDVAHRRYRISKIVVIVIFCLMGGLAIILLVTLLVVYRRRIVSNNAKHSQSAWQKQFNNRLVGEDDDDEVTVDLN